MLRRKEEKLTHKLWRKNVICNGKGAWHLQDKKTPCGNSRQIDENQIRKRGISYYGVICPICGCFIEISASDIPERVKDKALKI